VQAQAASLCHAKHTQALSLLQVTLSYGCNGFRHEHVSSWDVKSYIILIRHNNNWHVQGGSLQGRTRAVVRRRLRRCTAVNSWPGLGLSKPSSPTNFCGEADSLYYEIGPAGPEHPVLIARVKR
jgi:hypothetical protein